MHLKRLLGIAGAILLAAALVGCGFGLPGGTEKGTVTIKVADNVLSGASKTIMPVGVSLVASRYAVHGEGLTSQATGKTFDLDIPISEGTSSVELLPGDWSLALTVWSDDTVPVAIGAASAMHTVVVGVPGNVTLHALPYSGNGTLAIDLSWVPDVIADPEVAAEVKPFSGTTAAVPMTLTSSTSATGTAQLADGWYTAALRVSDNGVLSAGLVEAARIVKDYTSTWSAFLTVNALQGGITLGADWYPGLPLALQLGTPEGAVNLYNNSSVTLNVTGADYDSGQTGVFAWYRNGVLAAVSTTSSLTLAAGDVEIGAACYISAVVWQADGKRAGSAQWSIVRGDTDPSTTRISGTMTATLGGSANVQPWTVTIVQAASHTTVVRHYEAPSGSTVPFIFEGLPEGEYHIAAYADLGVRDGTYNEAEGDHWMGYYNAAAIIPIPHATGLVYNWTNEQ